MENRITSENISYLQNNEIFVFGSNKSGRHGKGAAKTALTWGAKYGQGNGIQGKTYGIPTKDENVVKALNLSEIKRYIDEFINYAINHPNYIFLVTEIGCGLAGYKSKDIAPLFRNAININNIYLPKSFWHKLI